MEPALTLDALRTAVGDGSIDTVVIAITDMQGRLQGKRLDAHYFLDVVAGVALAGTSWWISGLLRQPRPAGRLALLRSTS